MLRRTAFLFSLALPLALGQEAPPEKADASALIGRWKVDLRPTPDAEPYFQEFEVLAAQGGTLRGSFYGAPIESARTNEDWGRAHFAFVTRDGSGEYYTSGELVEGQLRGTTLSVGRDFLAVWTAERMEQ